MIHLEKLGMRNCCKFPILILACAILGFVVIMLYWYAFHSFQYVNKRLSFDKFMITKFFFTTTVSFSFDLLKIGEYRAWKKKDSQCMRFFSFANYLPFAYRAGKQEKIDMRVLFFSSLQTIRHLQSLVTCKSVELFYMYRMRDNLCIAVCTCINIIYAIWNWVTINDEDNFLLKLFLIAFELIFILFIMKYHIQSVQGLVLIAWNMTSYGKRWVWYTHVSP